MKTILGLKIYCDRNSGRVSFKYFSEVTRGKEEKVCRTEAFKDEEKACFK